MENVVLTLVQNPVLYIGYFLSAVGAVGALLFFAGFFGGIGHLFSYSEDADHMEHARTRAIWGIYLCMLALGLWECIRIVLGEVPVSSTLILVAILLSPVWIPFLKGLLLGKPTNGH